MKKMKLIMAGIYIHIPFCKQACHYCNFHFSTNMQLKEIMINAIVKELELRCNYLGNRTITSIYFGGGTPSLLDINDITLLLERVTKNFVLEKTVEVTLEVNPDDLTLQKLQAMRYLGINRLSIGIQSFQNVLLNYINRAHDGIAAIQSIKLAREALFDNINIDLIYAIPGSTYDSWIMDLQCALSFNPEHISAYCLTIEQKTVFGSWKEQGLFQEMVEEEVIRQYEILVESLTANGYEHYEISNFSKPLFYSKHNTNYWKQGIYLGIGPGAHSYNGIQRQYNISNNLQYIKSIHEGKIPCTIELLTNQHHINEYIMITLRTKFGCNIAWLIKEYGYNFNESKKKCVDNLVYIGLIQFKNQIIILTPKGRLLADKVAEDLFVD